ncbi:MAG: hypothetical protein LBH04_12490 [Tannerellaceae bacterium]|jgi:hypothetical protein|nr:hypothetical protein [Tannerellaceae bacterium]
MATLENLIMRVPDIAVASNKSIEFIINLNVLFVLNRRELTVTKDWSAMKPQQIKSVSVDRYPDAAYGAFKDGEEL